MEGFGNRLKEARESRGMTQPELAKACGKATAVTISRWETGKTEPSLSDVAAVCRALRINSDWLLGLDTVASGWIRHRKLVERLRKIVEEEE